MSDEFMGTATTDGEVQQPMTETVEPTVDTNQVTQPTEAQQERTFKQADVDAIIAKRLEREKGSFEKERVSIAQNARDSFYAEQNYEWNGKPIKTEAEYKVALKEQEIAEKIRSQYANVPDEVVNELLEGKRFREQYQTKEQQTQEKAKTDAMYKDFLESYPNIKPEEVPLTVWQDVKAGRNLTDAYVRYENTTLRGQLDGIQANGLTQQANAKNANASTGSAKAAGKATQGFISKEIYDQNKGSQKWMQANYDGLTSSMKHWK
jgi:hypothetical protein